MTRIAQAGAWINLLNLIRVWQLDGGRGFHALTRQHRGLVVGAALVLWLLTSETLLVVIALAAGYRLFTKDYPEQPDNIALFQFVGLLGALSVTFRTTSIIMLSQTHGQSGPLRVGGIVG